MKDTAYAFAVAYIRTLENNLLTPADLDALLGLETVEEGLRYLAEKGYGKSKDNTGLTADQLLKEERDFIWHELSDACPAGAPLDILLYPQDYHNLKTILKSIFDNKKWEKQMLFPCLFPPEKIYNAVAGGKIDSLPEMMRLPAMEAYDILSKTGDGQLAEIRLDRGLYEAMRQMAAASRDKMLIRWVELCVAVLNLNVALRGALGKRDRQFALDAMLPSKEADSDQLSEAASKDVDAVLSLFDSMGYGGASAAARESVSLFEKWCDNYKREYLEDIRGQAFGFGPILGFWQGKQTEWQAVRMALTGIENNIPSSMIKERIRDLYV